MVEFINTPVLDENRDEGGVRHDSMPDTDAPGAGSETTGYALEHIPLARGLIGWWPLAWGEALDLSSNGNHGTPSGGVTFGVAGRGGLQAMSFDGSDDYISINSSYRQQGPFTWTAWVKRDSIGSIHNVVHDRNGAWTEAKVYFQINSNDHIRFNANIDGNWRALEGSTTIGTDEWYHLTITYDGSTREVFVNGISEGTLSDGQMEDKGDSGDAAIGRDTYDNSGYFDGNIFDVRFYSRALSQSEIQTLYEWGSADLARPPTDGVARYALDGDATDSWGSNDGTSSGGLVYSSDAIRGQSGDFDGTDDYISTPVSINNYPATISGWVNPQPPSDTGLTRLYFGVNNYQDNTTAISVGDYQSDFYAEVKDGSSSASASTPYVTGVWNHLALVTTQSEVKLYLNGELASESSHSLSQATTSLDFNIGVESDAQSSLSGEYYGGLIDDVRVYDYTLSPVEVQELYRWGTRGIDMTQHTVKA